LDDWPDALFLNMRVRKSLITLLSNYACNVGQRGAQRLYCSCSGNVVTGLLLVGAAIATLAIVAFALLMAAGGNVPKGILGGVMGATLAAASIHLAVQRYRRHGSFELDGEHGVLRRYRAGRVVGEFDFAQVRRIWLSLDRTDGIRLDAPPSWLQVGLRSGEVFRLAKGSRQELAPVCDAMRNMGLALS